MAAKSDFAQKLLSDLRIRKERMGVAQGSARDAYRDPGNLQRGSQQAKSLKSISGSKSTNQRLISSRGSDRPLNIKETSQQIVTYTGKQHQRSESIGDLSVAFSYAVKNGGKLMNMDFSSSGNGNTMIDFLQQIGRRSLDAGNARNETTTTTSLVKHRPANGGVIVPALTTTQIKEISKGVQNLYEIIRSSSNGANVNRYSMDVGKELLKGAKGLEESLRMLVSLQEASEMMVKPQRKSRITLLEVDDDDNGDDERSKQVALPRFSFDKPSKKPNPPITDGSVRFPINQSPITSAKPNSNRSDKGRISNVIAKLMGLEEVPMKADLDSRRDETEILKPDDLNKNIVKKSSEQVKEDRKSQQIQDLSTNLESIMNKISKNNRSDRVSEKHMKQSNGELKEKMHLKRRSSETMKSKSNEIKLVPRSNLIQEPERKIRKSKHDSQQIKPVKNTNPVSKESKTPSFEENQRVVKDKDSTPKIQEHQRTQPKMQTFEGNLKAVKDTTPKTQEQEKTQPKMVPVNRKKVDLIAAGRSESPRRKDEVLRRRNRTPENVMAPLKPKLPVLKELKRNEVVIRSKPEEINTKRSCLDSNANKTETTTQLHNAVLACENEIKNVPQISLEIVVSDKNTEIANKNNLLESKPRKASYSSIQVVLTEQEKQLKEILIKDQLFLSTAEALFKLNIPVGLLHVDDQNRHENETKLKLDCGYEILKRKARSQELSLHPYAKPSIGDTSIRFLDELVKQLYKDLEDLKLYNRDTCNKYNEADYLQHMLEKDIHNNNPDINSFWDFGWHITTFTFVEKDEFVSDVERDMLCVLLDEIVDDLLSM